MKFNLDQRQVLADFYANLAVVLLGAGLIGQFFSPIEDKLLFVIRLTLTLIFARILLQVGLNKLK